MVVAVLILVVAVLVVFTFYKWATQNKNYFLDRNIPHLKPYFLVGNTGGLFANRYAIQDFSTYVYNAMPTEKIYGLFDIRTPSYVIRDAGVLKQLLVKDYEHFQDHRPFIDEKSDIYFGNTLLMMHGSKWRDMRATLSPTFTGSKMRQMFELINDCGQNLNIFLKKEIDEGKDLNFEMKDLFARYATDVVASTAFGVKVNSFENQKNEFYITVVPWLTQRLGIPFLDGPSSEYFKSLVLDTMDVRKKNKIFRPDMINMMMQLRDISASGSDANAKQSKDVVDSTDEGFATVEESSVGKAIVKRQWSDNELVAQCFVFFLGGSDTSATLMSLTAYELAIHPEIQEQLYQEIRDTNERLSGNKLSYDDVQKMKYMDQVFSESLRMWPPLTITDRICNKDYEFKDGNQQFRMEKGVFLMIPIYGYHHDPQNFTDPEKFDPERFSNENKHKITSGTYLPFGIGPRNCIGSRLALMQVKAAMYHTLLHFKIEPNEMSQIPIRMAKTLAGVATEKGVNLQFKLRH